MLGNVEKSRDEGKLKEFSELGSDPGMSPGEMGAGSWAWNLSPGYRFSSNPHSSLLEGTGMPSLRIFQLLSIPCFPFFSPPFFSRAAAYSKLGNYAGAVRDCERAIGIDPNYSKAYGRMG